MEKTVKKDDLLNAMRETGLSKVASEKALEALVKVVEKSLAKGKRVRVAHFGSFYVKMRKKSTVVTPMGKKVKVPAKKVVHFRASQNLKDVVNKKH